MAFVASGSPDKNLAEPGQSHIKTFKKFNSTYMVQSKSLQHSLNNAAGEYLEFHYLCVFPS